MGCTSCTSGTHLLHAAMARDDCAANGSRRTQVDRACPEIALPTHQCLTPERGDCFDGPMVVAGVGKGVRLSCVLQTRVHRPAALSRAWLALAALCLPLQNVSTYAACTHRPD